MPLVTNEWTGDENGLQVRHTDTNYIEVRNPGFDGVLTCSVDEWATFVASIIAGEFDVT